jgi:hypothetical protein
MSAGAPFSAPAAGSAAAAPAAAAATAAAPSPRAGVPPRKPLYLDGRANVIDVRLRGPALGIRRGAQQLELPLARLARVFVCGRVHWEAAAIAACLRQQIPIVFLDGRAQPIGSALPLVARTSHLGELLAEWVDRPQWREQYESWLRAQRYRILRRWRRQRAEAGCPVDPGEWSEAVRSFVYADEPRFASPHASGCYARALALLLRTGARTQYRGCDGGVLPLAADLARLADRSMALSLGNVAGALDGELALLARAGEGAAAEVDALLLELLQRLGRRAAEWIEPWP